MRVVAAVTSAADARPIAAPSRMREALLSSTLNVPLKAGCPTERFRYAPSIETSFHSRAEIAPQMAPAARNSAATMMPVRRLTVSSMRSTGWLMSPVLAVDVVGVVNIVAALVGFAAIVALVVLASRPDRDREEEDEARAHYDRHGSWPDDG